MIPCNINSRNQPTTRKEHGLCSLVLKFEELAKHIGELHGYERLVWKEIGTRYIVAYYIARFDRQPIVFKFELYKPEDKWRSHQFAFDADLDDWVEKNIEDEIGR